MFDLHIQIQRNMIHKMSGLTIAMFVFAVLHDKSQFLVFLFEEGHLLSNFLFLFLLYISYVFFVFFY